VSRQTLAEYDQIYGQLNRLWEKACKYIIRGTKSSAGFSSYEVLEERPGEVRLRVFGALAYVRFKHDLENGFLEYGALKMSPQGEVKEYLEVASLKFDTLGNTEEHFDINGEMDFSNLHLKTLAKGMKEIVRLHFDLPKKAAQ
jgi:hypothetical protein